MAKVRVKLDKRVTEKIRKRFKKALPGLLQEEIVEKAIKKGISPVKGKRKFKKYSDSYKRSIRSGQIKGKNKPSPVDMTVTGQMLSTFFVKQFRNGAKVGFASKLAAIHNDLGASVKKVIRRLLPTRQGEEFNRSITLKLRRTLQRIVKQETR